MKKVLTIGGATQDIFIYYDLEKMVTVAEVPSLITFKEGTKVEVSDIHYATGGGATNSAVSFKRLAFEVSTCVKVGQDDTGSMIVEALNNERIDTQYIVNTAGHISGRSFILPSVHHNQAILAYRGANTTLTEKDIPFHIFKNFDVLYITSLSGKSSQLLPCIAQQAKKQDILVANNPGSSQLAVGAQMLADSLRYIDIFILNVDEAALLSAFFPGPKELNLYDYDDAPELLTSSHLRKEAFNVISYFKEIMARGPKIVVVTNGAEGVYVAYENTIYFHKTFPTQVINTVGAGDAFASCFVACIVQNFSIKQALACGMLNAQSVLEHADAKAGLLTLDQLKDKEKKADITRIKKFSFR